MAQHRSRLTQLADARTPVGQRAALERMPGKAFHNTQSLRLPRADHTTRAERSCHGSPRLVWLRPAALAQGSGCGPTSWASPVKGTPEKRQPA